MIYRFYLTLLYGISLILFLFPAKEANAQKFYEGVLYPYNNYNLNPAYTGYNNELSFILNYRSTASTLEGMPKQIMFGVHSPFFKNMGLGLRIENYTEGLFNYFTGFLDYSYHLNIDNKQILRFGISFGYADNSLDNAKILATDPAAIQEIAAQYFTGSQFISAAGIVYTYDKFELSLAAPLLFGTGKSFNSSFSSSASYTFKVYENQIQITPIVFTSYTIDLPMLFDVMTIFDYKNRFQIGLGYRNRNSLIVSTGINFTNFKINYAADIGLNKLSNIYNVMHEISISYGINKKEKHQIDSLYNPPLIVKNDSTNINELVTDTIPEDEKTEITLANDSTNTHITDTLSEELIVQKDTTDNKTTITAEQTVSSIDSTKEIQDSIIITSSSEEITDEKTSETNKEIIPKEPPVITELSQGIYTLNNDIDIENIDSEELDSLISHMAEIDKESGYAEELTTGIYSIENMEEGDSIKNIDAIIEKIIIEPKTMQETEENSFLNRYFTIHIDFKKSLDAINKNVEILEKINVKQKNNGDLNYTYGMFLTKEEAEEKAKELKNKGFTILSVNTLGNL